MTVNSGFCRKLKPGCSIRKLAIFEVIIFHMADIRNEKKETVESMFDSIAWRYDFLNRLLSFGIDRHWRRKAIMIISQNLKPGHVLDVATGTGDFSIEAVKLNPEKITGIDISENMLSIGRKRIEKKGLSGRIELLRGDSENMPFDDNSFDLVMSAFGVRNFSDCLSGVKEMTRVVKNKGVVMILEFSIPENRLFRNVFSIYFFRIVPFIGHLLSGHRSAYRYLPESVENFPGREEFAELMQKAGLTNVTYNCFTCGIVTVYTGSKV